MLRRAALLSLPAGVFIGIGGTVFLSCENRCVGAVLFSVGLLAICCMGLFLFTGRVGYLAEERSGAYALSLLATLAGNLAGTLLTGRLIACARPELAEKAAALWEKKLSMAPLPALIAAFFCGVLMYTAVAVYKEKGTLLGVIFCVPVFILSGFEHSVADLFYWFLAGKFTAGGTVFLALVILGNTLGGLFVPALRLLAKEA